MKKSNLLRKLIPALLIVALAGAAFAGTLTGTVTNKTTNKPAAGDDVILLKLGQGMDEAGRTKTDSTGKFKFTTEDNSPYLVRVVHQSVTYHAQVAPGRTSADVDVYDAAKKIESLSATVQVMRFQGDPKQLQVTELYAVKNSSSPPKTLMSDRTFDIVLPDGAQVDGGEAISGNGLPITAAPVPADQKNHYYFVFPLRPGETRFQINYHVPYTGELSLKEQILYPMEHFVVMVPKSMKFAPDDPSKFQSMGEEPGATTMVSTSVKPGESLAFKVSGTGTFPPESDQQGGDAQGGGAPETGRPGGGLGPPSEAPDPLRQYRWYILGVLIVGMVAGAFYVLSKRPSADEVASAGTSATTPTPVRGAARPAQAASNGRSAPLLEALKEELFQLEVERQQGSISQADYEKAKAALDVTIGRAISRTAPQKQHV